MSLNAPIRRALLSVSDKNGVLELAQGLAEHNVELLSTGGTAKMLRAAGLPARPVIGIGPGAARRLDEFGVWAEVYLPECGWTPFDPDKLRQQSIRTLDATQPWEHFGTMRQLQRRIPLSWSFAPENGSTAFDSWSVWGWTRFLPSADFPATITGTTIQTKSGPFSLLPQRPVPSSIRLERK